jgi:hypothetical protein
MHEAFSDMVNSADRREPGARQIAPGFVETTDRLRTSTLFVT